MSLGTKIRQFRVAANMSQTDLANIYHVQRQTVMRWELDRMEPNINVLISMSFLFHISLEDLLRDEIIEYKKTQAESMKDDMLKKQIARKGKYVNMIRERSIIRENKKYTDFDDDDDDYDDFVVDDDFDDGIDDDELIAKNDFDDYKY